MKAPLTLTLLAMLASLIAVAPATAAPDAPAQEEYVLELPSAGSEAGGGSERGHSADRSDRDRAAGPADSNTLSTITADAGGDGPAIFLVILAATTLAGVSVAITKAAR